jgi:heterodisulfide reductase subunit A-like polyferredoxin
MKETSKLSEVLKMKGMPLMCSNVEVAMLKDEMQKLKDKQTFVSSWDPQTMLPPFTDVIMQATDGRLVHSHASTLVGS